MILGCLVGLVFGCIIGMLNLLVWRSLGPPTDFIVRFNVYVGTPVIVLFSVVGFAVIGLNNGW